MPASTACPPTDASRSLSTDTTRCPLCGGANACGQNRGPAADCAGNLDCWCKTATLDDAALARIPAALRGLSCICQACGAKP